MKNLESLFNLWLPSPLQQFRTDWTETAGLDVYIKRDDLIHHHVSGNKYRKLKFNFKVFQEGDFDEIIAFGGAFSNLLYTLSYIVNKAEIPSTFYVRGDGYDPDNPSLSAMQANGVRLRFIDRQTYRKKEEPAVLQQILRGHNNPYIIPEGGSNNLAVPGSAEIFDEIKIQLGRVPDYLVLDLGTGGTFAGVMATLPKETKLIGIPAIKGVDWNKTLGNILAKDFSRGFPPNIFLTEAFHFGGFAKFNQELIDFINHFSVEYGIPLDPIYTGKLAYGFCNLVNKGFFKSGKTVVWVHSGGLQGIAGFNYRFGPKILY